MALTERIITVYNDKGSKEAVKDIKNLEKKFNEAGKKIAKAFLAATAAAGALAVKLGKDAVEAAMADQKSQVLLATALRNTTGATDGAIAASEAYIASLQMQLGIADDQLRPALATLATASGDLAQAQTLLGLALDVSAGTGASLEQVTRALARAQNGSFTALSRLVPALDKTKIESGDLVGITQQLATLYGGAAQENANTFAGQLDRLKLAFGEILESVGYRLIPVLQNLVRVINEKVIPAIEVWLEKNGERLAGVFAQAVGYVVAFFNSLIDVFSFVARNANTFKQLGAIIIATFAGAKVAMAVAALIKGIKAIITVMKTLRTVSLASAAAVSLTTGGISAAAGATAFAAALLGVNAAVNKFTKDSDKATDALGDFDFKSLKVNANDYTKGLGKLTVTQGKNTKASKAATAAAKLELASKKALLALEKMGIKPTEEKDPIQLEAARLNLLRQGRIAEAERIKAMQEAIEVQRKLNEQAQRYADLLQVLSDQVISDEEVSVLAQKWGIAKTQVLEYIARIYAANTTEIDEGPVIKLLMAWGLTREEASRYVDFTRALKDEKLDNSEIEKLMGKWGMTRAEVVAYAKQVQDGTALQKVLAPSWAQPGDEAAAAWKRALQALNDYLKALNTKSITPETPVVPKPVVPVPVVPVPIVPVVPEPNGAPSGTAQPSIVTPNGTVISATPETFKVGDTTVLSGYGAPSASARADDTLREAVARQRISDIFATIRDFGPGGFQAPTNVTVNIGGNVVTEQDLTNGILDGLYQYQKQGRNVIYNAVAL